MPPVRPWLPGRFLCTTSSTLRELPVAGVNLLSAQGARIEIGGGGADPGERKQALDSLRGRDHDGVANAATRFTLRRGTFINVCLLLKGPSTRSRRAGNWGSSEPGELQFSELGELRTGGASTRGATK